MDDDATTGSGPRGIPREAQLAAAQLEDELATWAQRDPARPHPRVRQAAERASHCYDVLVATFDRERRELAAEIGAYDDAVRRGGE